VVGTGKSRRSIFLNFGYFSKNAKNSTDHLRKTLKLCMSTAIGVKEWTLGRYMHV